MQNDVPEYVPLEPPVPPKISVQPQSPKVPSSIRDRIGQVQQYVKILGAENVYYFLGWTPDQIKQSIGLTYGKVRNMIEESLTAKRSEYSAECKLGQSAKIEKGGKDATQRALFELLGLVEGGFIEALLLDEKGWRAYNVEIKLVTSARTQEKFDKTKDKAITDAIDERVKKFTLDDLCKECVELAKKEFTPESAWSCVWNYLFAEGSENLWGYDVQALQIVKENTDKYKKDCEDLQDELKGKIGNAEQEAKNIIADATTTANSIKDQATNDAITVADSIKKAADVEAQTIRNDATAAADTIKNKAEDDAETIKDDAEKEAEQIKLDAGKIADGIIEQANKDAGDIVPNAKKSVKRAKTWTIAALVTAASALIVAIPLSIYCVGVTAVAKNELAKYKETFDQRLQAATEIERTRADEAVAKADAKEADAVALNNSALESHKQANEKQEAADQAYAKAMEEQRIANAAAEQVQKDRIIVERDKNIALEKEKIAKETESRAMALMKEADTVKTEANRTMQEAVAAKEEARIEVLLATQEAERRVAVAETVARKEKERRMGVEAMIEAGAPLRFPSEEHERNDNARQQNDMSSHPVSSMATPLSQYRNPAIPIQRTAGEILRELTWRWCLEGELGIADDSELIGEVTERPRTGYRASEQGSLLSELVYPPPLGAFDRKNLLSPTDETLAMYNENASPDWSWEDWFVFRTTQEKNLNTPPGTFTLPKNEVLVHKEKLDRRFMLAQVPVTQELWESVMGNNPSHFKGAKRPVENVLWKECQEFIAKLNEMKDELGVPLDYEFALPWEAEWEHACRAGTETPFHFGFTLNNDQANYNSNRLFWTNENKYLGSTNVVEKYPANPWGLHDMHGNVWEWCQDAGGYGPLYVEREYSNDNPYKEGRLPNMIDNFYSKSASTIDGFYRSRRGGSWKTVAENSHSAYRSFGNPTQRHDDVGLRLCLAAMR